MTEAEATNGKQNHAQKTSEGMKAYWAKKRAEAAVAVESKPEPKPKRKLPDSTEAVKARYAGEAATESDLRAHFEAAPLDKAFALYERMRKNLEIAGRILNDRSNVPEIQFCKTCGITMDDYQKRSRKNDWFLNRPHYHQGDRNIIDVDHFCSAACVSLENNKTQGVYGISDQGMTQDMNKRNHPRQFPDAKS